MPSLAVLAAAAATASAANSWSVINANLLSEATGIAATENGVVYVAGGANGAGAEVLKSLDGGKTWAPTADKLGLLFLDVTAYGNNVLGASILEESYSNNGGTTFATSKGASSAAQCVRNIGPASAPTGFGIVGDFGLGNNSTGVGISLSASNPGAVFTDIDIAPTLRTDARYAAFPDGQHWFVSAGTWPASNSNDQPQDDNPAPPTTGEAVQAGKSWTVRKSERLSIHYSMDEEGKLSTRREWHSAPSSMRGALSGARGLQPVPNNTYAGQIAATTDGGKTWTSQFFTEAFYFNGIECWDQNNCCAVAECDSGPAAGAFIYCTWDAGAHWKMTYNSTVAGASLLDVRSVGKPGGYWAVGGIINGAPEGSVFLYSGDYGHTWTVDSVIPNTYATSVDCAVNTQECWATVLDATQTASIAYASVI